jgi:uncharacterized protein (TIGR02996 family)
MSSAKGFLQDICDNPDDDTPRLVFADWLEDEGDPDRAEFIRAQVRLGEIRNTIPPPDEGALLPHFRLSRCSGVWHCSGDSPERRDLAFRCYNLLDAHEDEWLASLRVLRCPERIWSPISPDWIGTISVLAGWGSDQVQLLLEELAHTNTLTVFDHAGDILHVETRSCWDQQEEQRHKEKTTWLQSLGYRTATIRVKRFPGIYDFPKSWAALFDTSDAEPEDYAAGIAFMERWLAEDGFRYGSFCGGWWFNRKSGQPIGL